MKTKYDWEEIDRKTEGKAIWAACDCGKLLAFNEKPEWDELGGWVVFRTAKIWTIKATEPEWDELGGLAVYHTAKIWATKIWTIGAIDKKRNWKHTLEKRPEPDCRPAFFKHN